MNFPPAQLSIGMYPAATVNSASSRLRCYGLGRELAGLGYRVSIGVDPANLPQILFVQKVVNPTVLALAQAVRASGGLVFYDIDDYGDAALGNLKGDDATFNQFIELVSAVVVDTATRQAVLSREPGFSQVGQIWVVPDPIDYLDAGAAAPKAPKAPGERLRACWFGNAPNIVPALPYLLAAAAAPQVADVSVITNGNYIEYFNANFPQLRSSAWILETFPDQFRAMDFCVLIHATTLEGVQKSNNKMLAALALGVLPFVSRTPAYTETAGQMQLSELIVDSEQDLLDRLAPENFARLVEKMHDEPCRRALQQHYPIVSARLFSDKLQALLAARGQAPAAPAPGMN
jgi:hypothetical protein